MIALPAVDSGRKATVIRRWPVFALLTLTAAGLAFINSRPAIALALPAGQWLFVNLSLLAGALTIAYVLLQHAATRSRAGAPASAAASPSPCPEQPRRARAQLLCPGTDVLANLSDVVFHIDQDGCWSYLNPAWQRLTGSQAAERLGEPFLQSLHPGDRLRVQEKLFALAHDPNPCICEARLRTAGGRHVWIELRARREPAETVHKGVSGTLSDISARRAAEEALGAKRHMLTTLLANVPGVAYRGRMARDWRMEFVSDGCFDLTGYEAADLINNLKVTFAELIHPADREQVWQNMQTGLMQHKTARLEYRIITRSGQLKWVWEQARGVYSSTGELLALEGFISDITERRTAEENARAQLVWDELTGLHNRIIFLEWVEYALALALASSQPQAFAVIVLDLDDFGRVNQGYGEALGDRILEEVGRRLTQCLGGANRAARLDSDEFAVLLGDFNRVAGSAKDAAAQTELSTGELAARLGRRIQEEIRRPMNFDGHAIQITTSIGLALSSSAYFSGEAMLGEAVAACHRAKFLRPTRLVFADPANDAMPVAGRDVRSVLTGAIGANALELCYHPVYRLADRVVAWWEPTLSWQHPRRGRLDLLEGYPTLMVSPELQAAIGRWMIREVLQEKRMWRDRDRQDPHARMCITLPCISLSDPDMVAVLRDSVREHGLAPEHCLIYLGRLSTEVDRIVLRDAMVGLHRAGFGLVVDTPDAGHSEEISGLTRYCSLQKAPAWSSGGPIPRVGPGGFAGIIAAELSTEEAVDIAGQAGCLYGQGPVFADAQTARSIARTLAAARP